MDIADLGSYNAVKTKQNTKTFEISNGMAWSIWKDKYGRKKENGEFQSWAERLTEVVDGNFSLDKGKKYSPVEYNRTKELALQGLMPFSGRHLQHGDLEQPNKVGEYFSNCSTAMFSWALTLLLGKGSGVGRDYSADMCYVNWDNLPQAHFVLKGPQFVDGNMIPGHQDYEPWILSLQEAQQMFDTDSEHVRWFEVEDSMEGWAKVVMILETAAFHGNNANKVFIFDFSKVRPRGAPIKGQQGRPSSGPVPFMQALHRIMKVKNAGLKPWKQALIIDHYLAESIVVGGVRRSARMATKHWKDKDVIEFIDIKRSGWLYTANNSVLVDEEFWRLARDPKPSHARRVFEAISGANYFDKTGEPGIINVDKLVWNTDGMEKLTAENYISPYWKERIGFHPKTDAMIDYFLHRIQQKKTPPCIVNPCSEIVLASYGGYCVIGDLCLAKANSLEETLDACRLMSHFLVRVNTMPMMYGAEVARTNRIGVSLTGIHEFAFKFFGVGFRDMVAGYDHLIHGKGEYPGTNVIRFWQHIEKMRLAAEKGAIEYADRLGVARPHTVTTIKPSGTISKVMGSTEGAHLPSKPTYMRWVQFPKYGKTKEEFNPEVMDHLNRGYPMQDIDGKGQYKDVVVIGFPTKLDVIDLIPQDKLVTAEDAGVQDQFKWLQLLERFWIGDGINNQVSYTLKWDPEKVSQEDFYAMLLDWQSQVRCCAHNPVVDVGAYVYQPEQAISYEQYVAANAKISNPVTEGEAYDEASLICATGACPIEPSIHGEYRV